MNEELYSSQFHSVRLHEEKCKGCTVCVTGCPVEAIRVRNGKAHILEERCIDCGECIRRCPNKAKFALSEELSILQNFDKTAALITPSIYSQFDLHYTVKQIHAAIKSLGFTEVYDVAEDAMKVSKATAYLIDHEQNLPHPLISSSCPTVIKLIQVRFPSLIDNILPLLPPVEVTALRARASLESMINTTEKIGVFLISPCPAKITVARSPVGYKVTAMNGGISFGKLYLPILEQLKKYHENQEDVVKDEASLMKIWTQKEKSEKNISHKVVIENIIEQKKNKSIAPAGIAWGRESGEAEYIASFLKNPDKFSWITTCGIAQIIETLEAIEDGQLSTYDFAEIEACAGGCLGGPLCVKPVSEGTAILRDRLRITKKNENLQSLVSAEKSWTENSFSRQALIAKQVNTMTAAEVDSLKMDSTICSRPLRRLSSNFSEARKMMEEIESIVNLLPGTDCGSCGAPNCRAFAEDIVRKKAKIEDCIVILKEKYENLLFGSEKK